MFTKLTTAYISHESCIMYYFYDMTNVYEIATNIKRTLKYVKSECDRNSEEDRGCKIKATLLEEQFKTAKENLEKLHHNRDRRFTLCEWCGKFQHYFYGLVDADEAREIMVVINNSSEAIKENRKIIYQTTHIVKAMLEQEEEKVNEIHERVKQFHKEIAYENDKIKRRDMLSITDSLIDEFKTMTDTIDQAFTAQSTGQIPKVIKTDDFISQVHSVINLLKPGTTFPVNNFENDISKIFQIATLHTRRIDNTILLKITFPICESESHSLFKATPVPIITDNSYLIANIEHNYFIVNDKKTEFTEMSLTEISEGIHLNENEILYRTRTLTEINPEKNCIWSQFLYNDVKKLISTCKLSPIRKSNYITTINDNDLYHVTVTEPIIFWEICENSERKFKISNTGFLQAKPECTTKTDDYLIKRHDNILLNFSTNIEPFLYGGSFSNSEFINVTQELPFNETVLETRIINSKLKIESLKGEAEMILKLADKKLELKKLEHDAPLFSFSFSLPSILTIGSILMSFISCALMYYCKCSIFKCLYDLVMRNKEEQSEHKHNSMDRVKEGGSERIQLKSSQNNIKQQYRKTPYVNRKQFEEDIEMGNEFEQ